MILDPDHLDRLRARTATIATIAAETGQAYSAVRRAYAAAGGAVSKRLLPQGPELLDLLADGVRPSEIAVRYGSSPSAVSQAVKRAREAVAGVS